MGLPIPWDLRTAGKGGNPTARLQALLDPQSPTPRATFSLSGSYHCLAKSELGTQGCSCTDSGLGWQGAGWGWGSSWVALRVPTGNQGETELGMSRDPCSCPPGCGPALPCLHCIISTESITELSCRLRALGSRSGFRGSWKIKHLACHCVRAVLCSSYRMLSRSVLSGFTAIMF